MFQSLRYAVFICLSVLSLAFARHSCCLTPFSLSRAEMSAILQDPRLYEMLGTGEKILQLEFLKDGFYLVRSNKRRVAVKVCYFSPEKRLGTVDFELEFVKMEN